MSGSKGQEIVYTWARLNTPTHKELSDTIDAALRRAKAEGWREAARLSRMRAHDHALAISRADDVLRRGVEFAKQIEAERIAEAFDARAAQIEEGE